MEPLMKTWVEQLQVQILVVVAIIQMEILKTEVEQGPMRTVFGHGLADLKRWGCFAHAGFALFLEKEWG